MIGSWMTRISRVAEASASLDPFEPLAELGDHIRLVRRGRRQAGEAAAQVLGRLDHVVRSFEWTRLEPHVVSVKFYAPHLGIVREQDVSGGTEFMELVAVHHG